MNARRIIVALLLLSATTAYAQTPRIEEVVYVAGVINHRFSDNGGGTWSQWFTVPWHNHFDANVTHLFVGVPAIVSDTPGVLVMADFDTEAEIRIIEYNNRDHVWSGWYGLHNGTTVSESTVFAGGVKIGGRKYLWQPGNLPALSARGAGRVELFINTVREDDGALALVHTWTDRRRANGLEWTSNWEVLGTGLVWGTPAAVSWGPGRTDVFVRAADQDIAHKWFDGGRWSRGWESMGCCVSSNPSVTSTGPGQLELYAIGAGDQALWHQVFASNNWSGWIWLGGQIGFGTSPAVTSRGSSNVEAFVYGGDGLLYQRSRNNGVWTASAGTSTFGSTQQATVSWIP